jgi:hypothetical protein
MAAFRWMVVDADFAPALANTSAGGEIDALTPGSYGAVTITKPVTIDGGATGASIDFTGSEGVYVDLSEPGVVRLEGLDIDGGGVGAEAMYDAGARSRSKTPSCTGSPTSGWASRTPLRPRR